MKKQNYTHRKAKDIESNNLSVSNSLPSNPMFAIDVDMEQDWVWASNRQSKKKDKDLQDSKKKPTEHITVPLTSAMGFKLNMFIVI